MTQDEFKTHCFENGIALIGLHTIDGAYVQISPSCEHITGFSPHELIGKNPYDFFHDEDKERMDKTAFLPILNSDKKTTVIECRYRRKDNSYIWLRTHTQLVKNKTGERDYLLTVSANIDSDKHKLAIIHKEEILLEQAGQMAKIGAWEVELETMTPVWSKVTYDIHEEEYDKPLDITKAINYYIPKDRQKVKEAVNNAITLGESWDFKHQLITAKGNKIWVRSIGKPEIRHGKAIKLYGTFQDITKDIEDENQQKELIEHLSQQKKQLVEFNQIVSHNLRSPVSSLTALLHFLEKADGPTERKEIIENIKNVNQSLNTLLNDLVDAVKIINDTEVKQEEINVRSVVNKTKKTLEGNIKKLNAKINFDETAWQKIKFPKLYFESIILNLMTNSLKYHSPERDLIINIALAFENNKKTLLFSDNGIGINLKRYGNKVFKMHKTFHRDVKGKGLGLFMTKNQIEAMGGTINVESEEGKGCTFKIIF